MSKIEELIKEYCYQGNGNGTVLTMSNKSLKESIEFAKIIFKDSEIVFQSFEK